MKYTFCYKVITITLLIFVISKGYSNTPITVIIENFSVKSMTPQERALIKGKMYLWTDRKTQIDSRTINLYSKVPQKITIAVPEIFRIEFDFPNFKLYAKNFSYDLHVESDTLRISNIALQKIESLNIVNAVSSQYDDNYNSYKIEMYNHEDRDIAVNSVKLSGKVRVRDKIDCSKPKGKQLKIDDILLIDNVLKGTYSKEKNKYKISGKYTDNYCSGIANISLKIPLEGLIIDKFDHNSLEILLPQKLNVLKEEGSTSDENNIDISKFEYLIFTVISDSNTGKTQKLLITK